MYKFQARERSKLCHTKALWLLFSHEREKMVFRNNQVFHLCPDIFHKLMQSDFLSCVLLVSDINDEYTMEIMIWHYHMLFLL